MRHNTQPLTPHEVISILEQHIRHEPITDYTPIYQLVLADGHARIEMRYRDQYDWKQVATLHHSEHPGRYSYMSPHHNAQYLEYERVRKLLGR